MKRFLICLALGISAGIIDVTPMVIQGLDPFFCVSAFSLWIIMGFFIPFFSSPVKLISGWLKGLLTVNVFSIPLLLLIVKLDPAAIPVIITFNTILGSYIGFMGKKFVEKKD